MQLQVKIRREKECTMIQAFFAVDSEAAIIVAVISTDLD